MSTRFDIQPRHAKPRHKAVGKWRIDRNVDGCLNCGRCADACLYDVHKRRHDDYRIMALPEDEKCRNCWMCVQVCPAQVLSMTQNPGYAALGDELYSADIISSIWRAAEKGEVPVSGCGYGGPFSGQGYDAMWTDMSEIVRPTRDGIHGREYISTVVDLGWKPGDVTAIRFGADGMPLGHLPPAVEIKIPILFNKLTFEKDQPAINLAILKAAAELSTFAILDSADIVETLAPYDAYVIEHLTPEQASWSELMQAAHRRAIVELDDRDDIERLARSLKSENRDLSVMVKVDAAADVAARVVELATRGIADIVHLHADYYAARMRGEGDGMPLMLPDVLPGVHDALVDAAVRDRITLVGSGDISLPERVPKAIILGADAVALGTPLLIALECNLCGDCFGGGACPRELERVNPEWGMGRIVNLMASWHNQILEILGAMGLREVSRLRGERGRAMTKEQLDDEIFGRVFGRARLERVG